MHRGHACDDDLVSACVRQSVSRASVDTGRKCETGVRSPAGPTTVLLHVGTNLYVCSATYRDGVYLRTSIYREYRIMNRGARIRRFPATWKCSVLVGRASSESRNL